MIPEHHIPLYHSFILSLHLIPETMNLPLSIATHLDDFSILDSICTRCVISLNDVQFSVDLIIFHMSEFNIILHMDWLSSYHVSLDCFAKTIFESVW